MGGIQCTNSTLSEQVYQCSVPSAGGGDSDQGPWQVGCDGRHRGLQRLPGAAEAHCGGLPCGVPAAACAPPEALEARRESPQAQRRCVLSSLHFVLCCMRSCELCVCTVACQRQPVPEQKLWKHIEDRHKLKGGVCCPTLTLCCVAYKGVNCVSAQ